MIKYNCPKCNAAMQADDQQVGTIGKCPACQGPVQVPAKKNNLPLILGITAALVFMSCGVCGVGFLVAIQILGSNANSSFQTVGTSIGTTVTGGR